MSGVRLRPPVRCGHCESDSAWYCADCWGVLLAELRASWVAVDRIRRRGNHVGNDEDAAQVMEELQSDHIEDGEEWLLTTAVLRALLRRAREEQL